MSTEILERDAACQAPPLGFRVLLGLREGSDCCANSTSVRKCRVWALMAAHTRTQRVCAWIRGCWKAQRDEFAKKLEREASIQECPAEAPACKREGSLRQPVLVAARIMNFPNVRRSMLRTPRLP